MLKEEQLVNLANGIKDVWKNFIKSVEDYIK